MFLLYKKDVADVSPIEYVPCDDITVYIGELLYFSSGRLVACTGTNTPTHVSVSNQTVAADGNKIPAVRIQKQMIFETTLYDTDSDIAIGEKHTVHTDGLQITATTSSGTAEIVGFDGTAAGSKVRVRF